MDETRKVPTGRGAGLMELMLKSKAESSQSRSGPSSAAAPPSISLPPGRGRASLLDMQKTIQSPDESRSSSPAISSGRASLLGAMKKFQ